MLAINSKAPDISLSGINSHPFELRRFADKKNVVLVFYPFDWNPVCTAQLKLYNELYRFFEQLDAVVIGISTDSIYCHAAFTNIEELRIPLLADFEPKGKVARAYGAYDEKQGHCRRALFLIDKNQTIVWNHLATDDENPGAEGVFAALDALNTGV